MSVIKFRAWHEENKEIVYFLNNKLKSDQYQMAHLVALMNGDYGDVLMQYTGLKDKNGVEIYKGDIVKCPTDMSLIDSGVVKIGVCENMSAYPWGSDSININYNGVYLDLINTSDDDIYNRCNFTEWEVIGNIYENPELLEVKS